MKINTDTWEKIVKYYDELKQTSMIGSVNNMGQPNVTPIGSLILKAKNQEMIKMESKCENCKLRAYAEKHKSSFRSRLWSWHTKWCPGWKAYQKNLKTIGKNTGV